MYDPPLPTSFYQNAPAEVARRLLGCLLCRRLGGERLAGRIVETEAYLPEGDLAAHQRRARSAATESLYGEAGTAYVHRLRHHHLLDVVTRQPGDRPAGGHRTPGGAVLIRAVEPLAGIAAMAALRGTGDLLRLAAGPGRLCQAFAIDRDLDGYDVTAPAGELWIAAPARQEDLAVTAGARIGIRGSAELALRFLVEGSAFVSSPPRKSLR